MNIPVSVKKNQINKSDKKIFNPYKKIGASISQEERDKIKKLIKNCKKCIETEIYDATLQRCVKRNSKNLARLKEFDKFCKVYKQEKIKRKNTDKLLFGKFLNMKLPGGHALKELIGKTRGKQIAYELEKKNKPVLNKAIIALPIVTTLIGVAFTNPMVFNFIKDKTLKTFGKNSNFGKFFLNLFKKSETVYTSEHTLVDTLSNLTVNISPNDEITKDAIIKLGVGTIDPLTGKALVNTKKLGINGISDFSDLSKMVISFDPNKRTFSLKKYLEAQKIFNYSNFNTQNVKKVGQEELDDIVVETAQKKLKVKIIKNDVEKINKIVKNIFEDKELFEKYTNFVNEINLRNNIIIDKTQEINDIETGLTNLSANPNITNLKKIELKDTLNKIIKKLEKEIENYKIEIEKLRVSQEIITKYQKNETHKLVSEILLNHSNLNIMIEKLNENNVNGYLFYIISFINALKIQNDKYYSINNIPVGI